MPKHKRCREMGSAAAALQVAGVEIMTPHNQSLLTSCVGPAGFTGPADFSSTVVLF